MYREGRRVRVQRARRLRADRARGVQDRSRRPGRRERSAGGPAGGCRVVPGGRDIGSRRGYRRPGVPIEWTAMAVRILFVEDEPSISDPFSKALVREGFEPMVART